MSIDNHYESMRRISDLMHECTLTESQFQSLREAYDYHVQQLMLLNEAEAKRPKPKNYTGKGWNVWNNL